MSTGAEVVVWWAVLTGAWVLTLSSASGAELGVGAGVALVAALVAALTRRAFGAVQRPTTPQWRALARLPRTVAADTVDVLRHAARPRPGDLRPLTVEGGDTDRALATLLASLSPGTVVVDETPARHQLTVHALVPERRAGRR